MTDRAHPCDGCRHECSCAECPERPAIPATLFHDAGAIARCSYCGRYTLDPKALRGDGPLCDCGKRGGWTGSFVAPDASAEWATQGGGLLVPLPGATFHGPTFHDAQTAKVLDDLAEDLDRWRAIAMAAKPVLEWMRVTTLLDGTSRANEIDELLAMYDNLL